MPDRVPDIIWFPPKFKQGEHAWNRLDHISSIAEPILGVDKAKGDMCYCFDMDRPKRYEGTYAHKQMGATIRYPTGHPKAYQDRYAWEDAGDVGEGVKFGYLKE